jgi:hypothetical protein
MHFTVAVITKEKPTNGLLDKVLAPYNENLEVPYYIKQTAEQYLQSEREYLERYKEGIYAEYIADPEAYGKKNCCSPEHLEFLKNFMEKRYSATDEELLNERAEGYPGEEHEDGCAWIDADGNMWSTYNPNSKWDWYQIGGRWSGELSLKGGYSANSAQIKDVDFGNEIDYEKYKKDKDFVEKYNKLVTEGDGFYKVSYLKSIYPTIEDYIRTNVAFGTFAVIDENGKWHEKGQMGWFSSSETPDEGLMWDRNYYDNFIKSTNPNNWITVVDCHI